MGWLYLAAAAAEAALALRGPWALPWARLVAADWLFLGLAALHAAAGILSLALPPRRQGPGRRAGLPPTSRRPPADLPPTSVSGSAVGLRRRAPPSGSAGGLRLAAGELLFLLTLVFFLFAWIFALNANLDYVQRFFAGGARVRLELDTRAQRLAAAVRYLPLLAADLAAWGVTRRLAARGVRRWALPLVLLSVALGVLSFPSFAVLEGLGFLGFVALVPLFLVVEACPWAAGWRYLTAYGVLQGLLVSFWLGTFSLVTLQLATAFFLAAYGLFFLPVLWLVRRLTSLRFLALALAWVLFEYLRSLGWWGYPWGLWGTAPHAFPTLLQTASLAGVWGVSLAVVLLNAGAASVLARALARQDPWPGARALYASAAVFLACLGYGLVQRDALERRPAEGSVRVALIQQNSDPRKDEYQRTFAVLRRLTDQALAEADRDGRAVELVVWSETAFVPNIRRWAEEDPESQPLARLVRELRDYQRSLGVWLLTGNDDYELARGPEGREVRRDYNAAVLFAPDGRRVRTYHKMHLVPFTEYFPFKESLPRLYRWLQDFDVYLWEPGRERVIFRHPRFSFFTPICFEDCFPDDVRRFVREGAGAIVNLSNDYWSLSEVEARQHALNSSLRAVENARPLLRATASGLSGWWEADGTLQASAPYYQEGFLVLDLPLRPPAATLYTRWGDWLPRAAAAILALLALLSLFPRVRRRL
jgi:apolipoprotein N-acyltransferase